MTAFEFDGVCTYVLHDFENQRDYQRLESLVKSFALMFLSMLGGDTSSILGEQQTQKIEDDGYGSSQAMVW